MKNKKSLLALILVVSMVLSMAPSVFAQAVSWIKPSKTVTGYVYDYESAGGFIIRADNGFDSVLVRPNGTVITPPAGTTIIAATSKYYLARTKDNKQGVYDMNNKLIVPMGKYDAIELINDTYYIVREYTSDYKEKQGLYKYDGSVVLPLGKYIFRNYDLYIDKNLIVVRTEDGVGVVDFNGKTVVPLGEYNDMVLNAESVQDKLIIIQKEDGKGIVDFSGNVVLPISKEYKELSFTSKQNRYLVKTEKAYKLIDATGKVYLEVPVETEEDGYRKLWGVTVYNGGLSVLKPGNSMPPREVFYDFDGKLLCEERGTSENSYYGIEISGSSDYITVYNDEHQTAITDVYGNAITKFLDGGYWTVYNNKYFVWNDYSGKKILYDAYTNVLLKEEEGVSFDINLINDFVAIIDKDGNYKFAKLSVQRPVSVLVNSKRIKFDQQPVIENGRTLVPIRAIFETLGAKVDWDNATQTATSTLNGITVKIKIDSDIMTVNGNSVKLDVPAKVINGRTLVPVRAVSEAFKCTVDWDALHNTVLIKK